MKPILNPSILISPIAMKTRNLTFELHCYGRPAGNEHIAVCLELALIAKGKNPQQARQKLEEQIGLYVQSLNKDNFRDLFPRMAPLKYYLDYQLVRLIVAFNKFSHSVRDKYQYFIEILQPDRFQVIPA